MVGLNDVAVIFSRRHFSSCFKSRSELRNSGYFGLPDWLIAAAIPLILPVEQLIATLRSGGKVISDIVVAQLLNTDRLSPGIQVVSGLRLCSSPT